MIPRRESVERGSKKRKITVLKVFPNEPKPSLTIDEIAQNLRHFFSIPIDDLTESFLGGKYELAELVLIRLICFTAEEEKQFQDYIRQKKGAYLTHKDSNQPYKPRYISFVTNHSAE